MFTLCYYAAIMLPLNDYYVAIIRLLLFAGYIYRVYIPIYDSNKFP